MRILREIQLHQMVVALAKFEDGLNRLINSMVFSGLILQLFDEQVHHFESQGWQLWGRLPILTIFMLGPLIILTALFLTFFSYIQSLPLMRLLVFLKNWQLIFRNNVLLDFIQDTAPLFTRLLISNKGFLHESFVGNELAIPKAKLLLLPRLLHIVELFRIKLWYI